MSFRSSEWIPAAVLWKHKPQLLRNFMQKRIDGDLDPYDELEDGVHPDWLLIDRIIAKETNGRKQVDYLVKW